MKIQIIGYIAGTLQLIGTATSQFYAISGGWWSYSYLLGALVGLSLGVFIILISTKLKI
tara:strand:+ start:572 stop:748 length:177 start_codon:yes stop_codon:yes gene_type:complete